MVCAETALAFLNRNKLLYLDMLEPIRRGSAELLYTADVALRTSCEKFSYNLQKRNGA